MVPDDHIRRDYNDTQTPNGGQIPGSAARQAVEREQRIFERAQTKSVTKDFLD